MRFLSLFVYLIPTNYGLNQKLLILGLGRLGREIERQAQIPVIATSRDFTIDDPPLPDLLSDVTHTICTIPLDQDETTSKILAILQMLPPGWIGLTSTSGVYGDHQGNWVDEKSECFPSSNAAKYLQMEQLWARVALEKGHKYCIFRCAGIYGNTRSALHTVLKNGIDLEKKTPSNGITNRIHEEDIARAMLSAFECESEVFNLADDLPESRQVVMRFAYDLLVEAGYQIPEVSKSSSEDSSIRSRRRTTERKLVDNSKMKSILPNNQLIYPTYKEGLRSILTHGAFD